MRTFKGAEQIDLVFFVIIALVISSVIIGSILLLNFGIKIGIASAIGILTESDTGGTALTALLDSGNEMKNAEILGTLVAEPGSQFDDNLESTLNSLDISLLIKDNTGAQIKNYGDVEGSELKADLALPGGRKGKVLVS